MSRLNCTSAKRERAASPLPGARRPLSLLSWLSGANFILGFVINCADLFTLGGLGVSRSGDRLTNTWGTQEFIAQGPIRSRKPEPRPMTGRRITSSSKGRWSVKTCICLLRCWVCLVIVCVCVCVCFQGVRGQAHAQRTQGSIVDFREGLFFWIERKKKGGFRGRLDECVDGGILIGVILTWQGPGSLMNQNVSARRWRWRAAHCGSDTHVRGWGCWGSSVTPH